MRSSRIHHNQVGRPNERPRSTGASRAGDLGLRLRPAIGDSWTAMVAGAGPRRTLSIWSVRWSSQNCGRSSVETPLPRCELSLL